MLNCVSLWVTKMKWRYYITAQQMVIGTHGAFVSVENRISFEQEQASYGSNTKCFLFSKTECHARAISGQKQVDAQAHRRVCQEPALGKRKINVQTHRLVWQKPLHRDRIVFNFFSFFWPAKRQSFLYTLCSVQTSRKQPVLQISVEQFTNAWCLKLKMTLEISKWEDK